MKPERVAKYKKILQIIQWSVLRYRSVADELQLSIIGGVHTDVLKNLDRRVFDDKDELNILEVTQTLLNKIQDTGQLTSQDVYNFLFLANESMLVEAGFLVWSGFGEEYKTELPNAMKEFRQVMMEELDEK